MRLETQRLILRKPKLSDWKDIVEACSSLKVSSKTQMPHPYHKKDAISWIKKSLKGWGKENYPFGIELKSEKKYIGCIDIHHINKISKKAITGSWMNPKYQRRGYITEAKIAANNFAFDKLGLRKLKSEVYTDNLASNKTQKGVGYKLEGVMRKESVSPATKKVHDSNLYGLLKEDWKKVLPKVKKRLEDKIKRLNEK